MECLSYCIAEKISISTLEKELRSKSGFKLNKHWRALEIYNSETNAYCYVFSNGTIVAWNLKRYQMKAYFDWILLACTGALAQPLFDGFFVQQDTKTTAKPHDFFNVDCFFLESDDAELKLSLSYGCSQSIKLKYYEARLEALIEQCMPISMQLRTTRSRLSRKKIRSIISDIILFKAELNLTSNFLYQPKFFWQKPSLEPYFAMLERYLDIFKRTETLNKQLNTLNEVFILFSGYLDNKHSNFLEIIIIVLIALEILFNLLKFHI